MKQLALSAAIVLAAGMLIQAVAQNGMPASQSASGKIGESQVWPASQDFINKAHTACDKAMNPVSFSECFMNQMSAAGAPGDAVAFTRMLYQENGGLVGTMSMFKKFGPVDAAQVLYPLRANDNYALLLVNGDPKILDVDDLQKLDQTAMQQDAMFQSIKKQFPNATLFPGDRSGNASWPRVQPLPNGGQQFIVNYLLLDGCHACKHLGVARFGWNFDANGKFLETTYVPTPPPPKLLRHPRGQYPGQQPTQPQNPQQ